MSDARGLQRERGQDTSARWSRDCRPPPHEALGLSPVWRDSLTNPTLLAQVSGAHDSTLNVHAVHTHAHTDFLLRPDREPLKAGIAKEFNIWHQLHAAKMPP